ncbi:Uncharacterized protein OS=Blastopirellula marina DSM 3645 GN=DSM3645_24620 PE=4 SV=1 [Gemmataceae bacterium]|nr:Uncharacterized protein OS=Blastopirellula marina DSM 3645 GN=DSM3645_24620 PE=4 SV=1 [Gemmataceae bacterium]VTU02670.1 Uncharacterized protein OS=Blastopirellula marina DSM 3645 GN=DSM3645_24620 PE=4 SV=1 [Gemmataceae bacterium]
MTLTGSLRTRLGLALLTATLATVAAGCGKKETPLYPVTGKVLINGKPAEHATVVFHPVGAAPDTVKPRATVGPDGTFKLTSVSAGDGAAAGDYAVTVEWWLSPVKRGDPDGPPVNFLAAKFGKPETSGLKAQVQTAPTDLATIELK